MNGVEILQRTGCNNLADLISCLRHVSADLLDQIPDSHVTVNDGAVVVRVERQVLTDKSEVYNVNIEPARR